MIRTKTTVLALLVAVTPQTRAAISRAFKADDFEILWTANPSEAVEAGARNHFDVLLLDLNQPLLAAWGTFERLTALNTTAPVVLLTAQRSKFEETVGEKMGVVLQKPLQAAALVDAVNTLLKTPAAGAAPGGKHDSEVRSASGESENFRATLLERYHAPYILPGSYRHWGINE
jgi:DNA-binding response OmpR family regulator